MTVSDARYLNLMVDPRSTTPLYRQVCEGLRQAIRDGRAERGSRLPSSRALAQRLGLSRNTISLAFEQLVLEGYLSSRTGSGTFVADQVPDETPRPHREVVPETWASERCESLSTLGLARSSLWGPEDLLQVGTPPLDLFPRRLWGSLAARTNRHLSQEILRYGDVRGSLALREALAHYLSASRGVSCHADQVFVVCGSQQAIDLATRVLTTPGQTAALEDPGFPGAHGAFIAHGLRVDPIPVTSFGLDVAALEGSRARLVFVTPDHQFPTGVTLSREQRALLIQWARQRDAWILEDDGDSELQLDWQRLDSLQSASPERGVILVGSFSRILAPGLRVGYMVVPESLVASFKTMATVTGLHAPHIVQETLAAFISEGHLYRHLRRVRKIYRQRRESMNQYLHDHLAGLVDFQPGAGSIMLWLPHGTDERGLVNRLAERGVDVMGLSGSRVVKGGRPALLVGYSAPESEALKRSLEVLVKTVREALG